MNRCSVKGTTFLGGCGGETTSRAIFFTKRSSNWRLGVDRERGNAVVGETDGATILHSGRRRVGVRGIRWLDELRGLVRWRPWSGQSGWWLTMSTVSGSFWEREPLIELFLAGFHLCRPGYTHDEDSKRFEVRDDRAPALLATLALYFEFFDIRAYDNSTAKCLFLRALTHALEDEIETANGWREALEGSRRTKPSIDWLGNGDRRVD